MAVVDKWQDYANERGGDNVIETLLAEIRNSIAPTGEYTPEIGEAGDRYLKSVSLDGRYHLSGRFRWYELWDAMRLAPSSNPRRANP